MFVLIINKDNLSIRLSDEDQYASIAEEDQYVKDEQREGKNKGPVLRPIPVPVNLYKTSKSSQEN